LLPETVVLLIEVVDVVLLDVAVDIDVDGGGEMKTC